MGSDALLVAEFHTFIDVEDVDEEQAPNPVSVPPRPTRL